MTNKQRAPLFYTTLLYLTGFFLFMEWLYPAVEMGEAGDVNLFMIYAAFCFLVSLFHVKWWLTLFLKGSSLLIIMNRLFYPGALFKSEWIKSLIHDVSLNVNNLFLREWFDLTPSFRSLLFLLLIWMMSYLIYYWFIDVKRIRLFLLMTFIYVGGLDTFTTYDGTVPIVRIFGLALIALMMVNLSQAAKKESLTMDWFKRFPAWVLPLLSVVLLTTFIGYQAPYYPSQWDDPLALFMNGSKEETEPVTQKSGYGEDDSKLGGSFILDDTPVFHVRAKERYYYRIETKDHYTGKGWIQSEASDFGSWFAESQRALFVYDEQVKTTTETVHITLDQPIALNKILYPYGMRAITPEQNVAFRVDQFTEAIQAYSGSASDAVITLPRYTITFDYPHFDLTTLRTDREEDHPRLRAHYTQLPERLPKRVGNLAQAVTAPYDNRYDQVKAIEQYFGAAGFQYQTEDVLIPGVDEDYVDQFLFESQVGYCDNYSTAMVVMLRTLDIPARWVKGFTSGEQVSTAVAGDGFTRYQVTNANAHAWVEVYFPDTGWVPFEPTQGFDNDALFTEFTGDEDDEEDTDLTAENTPEQESEQEIADEETTLNDLTGEEQATPKRFSLTKRHLVIVLSVLVVFGGGIALYLYRFRDKLKTDYLFNKYAGHLDEEAYVKLYDHMVYLLSKHGLAITSGQTLREYALEVDEHFGTNKMTFLTRTYEEILYNDQVTDLASESLTKQLKAMIEMVISPAVQEKNDQTN